MGLTAELDEELQRGSHLKLAQRHRKILASPIIGERVWQAMNATPGVTGKVSIRFISSCNVPLESRWVFELPLDGWTMQAKPGTTVHLPNGQLPVTVTSFWNPSQRVLELVTAGSEILKNVPIEIILSGVTTPECATSEGDVRLSIYEKKIVRNTKPVSTRGGQLLAGPSILHTSKILPGELLGKKVWVSRRYAPGVSTDVSFEFRTMGRIPTKGKILIELPDQGWDMSDQPHVVLHAHESIPVKARWIREQSSLEICLEEKKIEMDAPVSINVAGVMNPRKEEGNSSGRVTSLVENGGVIDGPTKISVSRISALTAGEEEKATLAFQEFCIDDELNVQVEQIPALLERLSIKLPDGLYEQWVQKEIKDLTLVTKEMFLKIFASTYAPSHRFGQALRVAAGRGEIDAVAELIGRGCDPNGRDGNGWSSLHYAAEYGQVGIIKKLDELMGKNLEIDIRDKSNWTPLMSAASNARPEAVEALIKLSADINSRSHQGRAALHWAATKGLDAMCTLLIRCGADLNAIDRSGYTPLHCAALHGSLPTIKLLLEKGADSKVKDTLGHTFLHYCDDGVRRVAEEFIEDMFTKNKSVKSKRK